jgi:hypothetical protein
MRFMMIVKANRDSEAGVMPGVEMLTAMGKYNEELIKAGVMLDGAGLMASSEGARIYHTGGKMTVKDGPFTEASELIAGFWIIQVKSKAEAIEWAKRVPHPHGSGDTNIELRRMFENADFEEAPDFVKEQAKAFEQSRAKA